MAEIIKKYCETKDAKLLTMLNQQDKAILRAFAKIAYQRGNKLGKKILDDTKPKIPESKLDKSQEELDRMSVGSTGAREGDTLIGIQKGSSAALIKVLSDVYPSSKILNRLRYYPEIWEKFLIKLDNVPHFSRMSKIGRELWLDMYEIPDDFLDMKMELYIMQPGLGNFEKKTGSIFVAYLPEEIIDEMMAKSITPKEINDTLIEYTGKSSTLVTLKTFWKVFVPYNFVKNFNGTIIDVETGTFKNKKDVYTIQLPKKYGKEGKNYVITEKERIGFHVEDSKEKAFLAENKIIDEFTVNFTAAAYKSLLQKIIRFTPVNVVFGDNKISGKDVLEYVVRKLIHHPGAFVPNIQRFVTGKESAPKRIAVSIYEDSYLSEENYSGMLSLLSGALVAQRIKEWTPSEKLVKKWIEIAQEAYEAQKGILANYKKYTNTLPFTFEKDILTASSVILDELRSFPTDLGLARAWAKGDYKIGKVKHRPQEMPFYHCVDQHWLPEIAYFYSFDVFENMPVLSQSEPFHYLFDKIFHEVTGVNPRNIGEDKKYEKDFEDKDFVKETRKAQQLVLYALQTQKTQREITGKIYTTKYIVNDAWLAGMVGVIKIKLAKAKTFVTLKVENPLELVVAREPISKRTKKVYEPLTTTEEEESINKAVEILKKGVKLNQCKSPVQILENASLFLVEENDEKYYEVKIGNKKIRWDEVKKTYLKYDIIKPVKNTFKNGIKYTGKGVEENFEEKIETFLRDISPETLKRILIYFSGATLSIKFPRIGRDGGGTGITPVIQDVDTFQKLCKLSLIVPGAFHLEENKTIDFVVESFPLFEIVVKIVKNFSSNFEYEKWPVKIIDKKRKLYDYQTEALKDMTENYYRGNKGNFLWLPLGSGKTFLVLSYLGWLRKNKLLPKYVIYTLPPESLASIVKEINYFDLDINLIIPLKNITKKRQEYEKYKIKISNKNAEPFCINLIFHDHLRLCSDLEKYVENGILIIDEVHLFLNQTIRTSIGINLAKLSKLFVCLTGTPIVDNKTEKLLGWFEQIVSFEVNGKNFWAAANNMISKEITTGIKTENEDITAKLTEKEEKEYMGLVPVMMGGTNDNPRSTDWMRAADICYEACDRKMVKICMQYIKDRGIMVVARNLKHQEKLREMLVKEGVKNKDIFLIKKDASIFLTDESVENGEKDYKVVIVPKNRSQGYTLTRLSMMITSVYPSNTATREQLRGRINRIGQKTEPLLYKTVHAGLLTYIMQNHLQAGNILQALQSLSKKV